jgi:hypothetical protein
MISNFKLFESIEDEYKVIANNESYYSWDYDSYHAIAKILLDESDNSLYLKITDVHVKTGLGAGKTQKQGEFIKIGYIYKADLATVRLLLKKHQYDQRKFSRFWEDEEGNKMSLTDLLKMIKLEKSKKELKHIKTKTSFEEPIKSDIELVHYSNRSYALFGNGTKSIKDELIGLGCKYNRFLTDPKTGEKRPGWILSIGKLDKVKELL